MRDSKEFKERFLRWKNGEKVYDAGRIVGYTVGKEAEYWDAVKDFVAQYEGFKDTTYLDGKGIPTIGYGFTDPTLTKRGKISRSDADKYFIDRLKKEDNILRDTLTNWDQLGTDAKKALISYRYNYPAGFKDTTNFIKYWNAGDYMNAIKEVDAGWNDTANPGLRIRRQAEQALLKADPFLSGKVNASIPIEDPASLTFSKPAPPLDFTAPRVSTSVNQPFRKVAADNQVNSTAGWKAMNHFLTLNILDDLAKGYDWKIPKLPSLFPLNGNQWTQSLIGYEGGKDDENGGFLNRAANALIGASVADAPAVATASGWHNEDGQWRLNRTAADEDLGRRLVDISMMSPTNPATAALDGVFRLAAKGVKLALPGVKLALYKIHPRVKQNTIDIIDIPEFNFDFPQDNLPELSYDASIDDIILYAADNNTTIDFPTYPELLSKWKSEAINAERRAMDFYKNDVIPRTKNVLDFWIRDFGEIDKPNMNVYYNKFEEYPHDLFHTFAVLHSPKKIIDIGKNESKYLGFANQDGITVIKQKDWLKDLDDTIVHEGEHALRYNIGIDALISKNRQINDPATRKMINTLAKSGKVSTVEYAYSPSEIRALDDAYLFTSDFLKENKIHLIAEKGATNRELRYKISKMNNYAVGSDLDAIIDKMSTKDIISLLENGNGYSRNFLLKINNQIDNLVTYNKYSREDAYKEIWNKYRFNIKRALKTVPVGAGVAATTKKQLK